MMKNKFVFHGIVAGLALSAVYLLIVGIAQGFSHAVEEFISIWYLMVPLVIGFGVQVGLFSYTHHALRSVSSKGVAASGGVSTVSMVACCAHHITDILPLIGLTAFALFLAQYQNFFVVLGILSNLIGILFILGMIQSRRLYNKKSFFRGVFAYDMKKLRTVMMIISVPILIIAFLFMSVPVSQIQQQNNRQQNALVLPERTNSENGLTVSATPVDFSIDKPVKFEIKLDTHQGSLDFDVMKISALEDSNGLAYIAVSWDGAAAGGHHREGILTFPKLSGNPSSMTLTMKNAYGAGERAFSWDLATKNEFGYYDISSAELKGMLGSKDFLLVDVHIPEQSHINGTDLFIPYNELGNNTDKLPQDKSRKIVLYCRSGTMSTIAAKELVSNGYTNVYNLKNGVNEWMSLGYPL